MHVDMNHPISIPLVEVFIFPDVLSGIPEYETLERENEELLYGNHPRHKEKLVLPQREKLHFVLTKYPRLVLLEILGQVNQLCYVTSCYNSCKEVIDLMLHFHTCLISQTLFPSICR